ncbi:MAG: type B DNA-directed DNA polymerase [Candidatus Thermoplasmatota archaeon]|nr:type B DNA-directed DNA polymerase [Candidatus Thermoplasmatota archaeon]MCL6002708.1 type B DNA-directed DNA polymerase [Candidatus Thermoplasmatota archaeon]
MIVDAWAGSSIFTIDEDKKITKWNYDHTMYVAGDRLERITDEIDLVPWIKWKLEEQRDIYSSKKVVNISLPPNKVSEVIMAIEKIGNFRDYKIYNADINIVQSFMVKNNLHFFDDENDMDFEIPKLNILEVKFIDELEEIEIDGQLFTNLPSSLDYFFSSMKEANLIISEGGDKYFPEFFTAARRRGYSARTSRSRERVFTSYGRISHRTSGFIIYGIPHIDRDTSFIFSEGGLEGLVTISKITSLPLFTSARITPGTAVSSYEVRKSLERGIMIPLYKDDREMIKDLDTFISADRGGLYLQPIPGVYESVYEIDFSSMYPSIIVNYNLSPETINVNCKSAMKIDDLGYEICMDKRGILSEFLSDLLDLRLYYKSKKNSDERYRRRDAVLKWLLLTSFGYTGYKNAKFGRIEVHESITSLGRKILTDSVNIAKDEGFKVIHGIVDSLWLQGSGDIHNVMRRIDEMSKLKIALEGFYKWIVFLPARDGSGALNRYFGLMDSGQVKVRGIELRRTDFPNICKEMQEDILRIYSKVSRMEDFNRYYDEVAGIYDSYKSKIINGKLEDSDLKISIVATRRPEFYRVNGIRKKTVEKANNIGPGDKVSMFVIDERRGIVDIKHLENRYDKNYYLRKLEMSWESISYPFKNQPLIYQKSIEEYDTD